MKTIMTSFLLILGLSLFAQTKESIPKKVGMDGKVTGQIDNYFNKLIGESKIGGAVILLSKNGKVFHFKSYGWTDKEVGIPMTTNSIFNIASMTKTFVTVSILILKEDGLLKLDDPITKYIPEIAGMKVGVEYLDSLTNTSQLKLVDVSNEMTIRHLMSHTSGFMSGWLYKGLIADQYNEAAKNKYSNLKDLVGAHSKIPLGHQPGAEWKYDFSTNVLAYLIEILSKRSLEDFFKENILGPLKMKDTGYNLPEENNARVAKNYYVENGQLMQSNWMGLSDRISLFTGTGGMWSTAEDYFKLCQMILNKGEFNGVKILDSKTIDEVFEDIEIGKDGNLFSWLPGYGFGLGFAVRVDNNKSNFSGSQGELCSFGVYNTAFWIDPKEKIIGIELTHFPPGNLYQFSKDLRNIVYSSLTEK